MEALEDAGLLNKDTLLGGDFPDPLLADDEDRDDDEEAPDRTETS